MRLGPILALAALLSGCQLTGPSGGSKDGAPGGLAVDEISVTPLDSAQDAGATATETDPSAEAGTVPEPSAATVRPRPSPMSEAAEDGQSDEAAQPEAMPEPAPPEEPKSPEQLLCEKAGGIWSLAGDTGAYLCVSPTRDGGKSCRRKQDCQGECLARSNTCAPFKPLFGCNDVLDMEGRRMTLCLD